MLTKIVRIFSTVLVVFRLAECATWIPINNTCTAVNPPTSVANITGLSYVYYWNGPIIFCAFLNFVPNANGSSYTSTFTYADSNGTMFSTTLNSLVNPDKAGEVEGYYFPNDVPTRVSDIAAFVSQLGFGLIACPFTQDDFNPTVAILQFSSTEDPQTTASLLAQMESQNLDVKNLNKIHQGTDCQYTVLTFEK